MNSTDDLMIRDTLARVERVEVAGGCQVLTVSTEVLRRLTGLLEDNQKDANEELEELRSDLENALRTSGSVEADYDDALAEKAELKFGVSEAVHLIEEGNIAAAQVLLEELGKQSSVKSSED